MAYKIETLNADIADDDIHKYITGVWIQFTGLQNQTYMPIQCEDTIGL